MRLTDKEWEALCGAVALAECEWDVDADDHEPGQRGRHIKALGRAFTKIR